MTYFTTSKTIASLTVIVVCLMALQLAGCQSTQQPASSTDDVPGYLQQYAEQYAQDPRAASVQWFRDAKLGMFVHYALASVLEGGKPELLRLGEAENVDVSLLELPVDAMADAGLTQADIARHLKFRRDLMDKFDAKNFDADAIVQLALDTEMKYITFTTKHLGGMRMYRTSVTDFNSLNAPAVRDLVAEMAEACARKNMGLFLYVPPETARTDGEFFETNRTILRELLTQYGPIAGIWFDGIGKYFNNPENYTRLHEQFAFIRSMQPQCLISFKEGGIEQEDFISPEHFHMATPIAWENPKVQERWDIRLARWKKSSEEAWNRYYHTVPVEINTVMQECNNRDGVGEPGGWINDENARHLSVEEMMLLVKVAHSQGANLLINIGPRGDGSVHPDDLKTLKEIGRCIRADGYLE